MINVTIFLVLIFYSFNANAYFDPGLGSLILQSLIAFFAMSVGFISLYWQKLKNFFSKFKKKNRN